MLSTLKNKLFAILFASLFILWWAMHPLYNSVEAVAPRYQEDFASQLTGKNYVLDPSNYWVNEEKTLRENVMSLFYPGADLNNKEQNRIYHIIRNISLWVMIIFIIIAWGSLLLNKKPDEAKKHLFSLLYILLWWVFIYAANWLFWEVLNFWRTGDMFTSWQEGLGWFTSSVIWKWSVLFVILSAVKAFAFFLAIIMIVITWFKVIAAWEWDKWKKLIQWLINVVVALIIIKWVDFIYYLAADSSTFVKNTSELIINVAKIFGYLYWVIIVIMVIVSWYLYITDGWDWSNFKKASNVLINILLSALVLFSFLLITYQIFAEFQKGGEAVNIDYTQQIDDNPG